jgi:hypothetical protein
LLKNHYQLVYYGVKFWNGEGEALEEHRAFLTEQGLADPDDWKVVRLEEHVMKLGNVKLKNNPDLVLFLTDEGHVTVRSRDDR